MDNSLYACTICAKQNFPTSQMELLIPSKCIYGAADAVAYTSACIIGTSNLLCATNHKQQSVAHIVTINHTPYLNLDIFIWLVGVLPCIVHRTQLFNHFLYSQLTICRIRMMIADICSAFRL